MTSSKAVFRPGAGTWALHIFLTLAIALNSLFWFFDPVPAWVPLLGGLVIAWWLAFLVALARARVELAEDAIEIHSPPYRILPSRGVSWFFGGLLVFFAYDFAVFLLGTPPPWARQLRFVASLAWTALYFVILLRSLERGRQTIRYADIRSAPVEDLYGPYRWSWNKALFMNVEGEPRPFQLPPWLSADSRREIAGRVAARVKHAHALESGNGSVSELGAAEPHAG